MRQQVSGSITFDANALAAVVIEALDRRLPAPLNRDQAARAIADALPSASGMTDPAMIALSIIDWLAERGISLAPTAGGTPQTSPHQAESMTDWFWEV